MIAYTDVIIRNVSVDMFRNCVMNAPEELPEYDENIPLLEDIIVGSLQKQRLMDFIVGLPQLQRDIMELRISFGMSNSEIANQLKISENVVRQRLYQSRKAITEFLKKENRNESI
jgi:RNA polymerase sigma factor (sigma-70 family)